MHVHPTHIVSKRHFLWYKICQFSPFSLAISNRKASRSKYPINNHRPSYANRTISHIRCNQKAEPNSENNHTANRYPHRNFHIIACPECIGKCKCNRPNKQCTAVMNPNKRTGQFGSGFGKTVQGNNRFNKCQHKETTCGLHNIRPN